ASAESTQVNNEIKKFQDEKSIPAIIAFTKNDAVLSSDALAKITTASKKLASLPSVTGEVSPPIISQDGKAALVVVNMQSGAKYKEFVPLLKASLDKSNLPVDYKVTGPVGFLNDLAKGFAGIDGLLLGVALAVVFMILLIVYRSPILPFLVLINSMFALCASILIVYYLAQAGILTLNGQVQGILFILVIGAATDYALLFIARYREELTKHKETYQALIASWKRSIEPIAAAGGTVIAGLLCLLLSDLNSNKALGPVGAIGIAMAIIATLTFLPSLMLPWGRTLFWPRKATYSVLKSVKKPSNGVWQKVSHLISHHSRIVWITTTLVLVVMASGIIQLKADGIAQSDFILGTSEARDGQAVIDAHFPGGSGTPTQIIITVDKVPQAVKVLEADKGVASVSAVSDNSTSGSVPLGKEQARIKAAIREGIGEIPNVDTIVENSYPFKDARPKVVGNEVLLQVTLADNADSEAAQATVERLRSEVHMVEPTARVGGNTAVQLDTRKSAEHDRAVVIPAVLVVITIILMVLLRSIFAPLILLATTMLSFTAILGVSALVFNNIFQFPGADPSVVLYGFIFLVALGIDYNIFLMTRAREESLKHGTRKGIIIALVATGSVITSAGIVLAATFAALAVIPILFLVQLAFIVALGVLIDTVVVRSLLVPAIAFDLKKKIWWPSTKHKD
ncbi:MMPL family transporter, partial [Candidatus Saccharibacteria bacterium]|nr:MMPL family transporter [Candidatus Saccharibacteria bacterium]